MAKEIPLHDKELNSFISGEKGKVLSFLRNRYSVSDDDLDDIFQEASMALFNNIRGGKLTKLTSSLGSYFMSICNNQALKFIGKQKKEISFDDGKKLNNTNAVRDEKVDELYNICIDTEAEDRIVRKHMLVNQIIASMTETCKDILLGYYWHDYSTSTIADLFNFKDTNSVKTQKYKCAQKFRNKFNELINKIYG